MTTLSEDGRIGGLEALRVELPHMRRSARWAVRAVLFFLGGLVRVEGAERLRRLPEPVIFAFNHNNSLEAVLVPAVLIALRRGRNVRFAVDWMFIHLPLIGWLIRLVDPVPVYTKPFRWKLFESYRQARRHRSPVDGLAAALAAGESVGIFPEGTRNPHPRRLARGRSGLGHVALASTAPVVPVGIDYPAKERLGRAPRLGRTVVRVGEPLDLAAERQTVRRAADGESAGAARRLAVRAVVERVMRRLAALCGKSYEQESPAAEAA